VQKLCILGDDVEPCFEGASVTAPDVSTNFTLDDNFKHTLYSMMKDLQNALKGGQQMDKLENAAVQAEQMQEQVQEQSDEEALKNIELFPTWKSKMGESVSVGERLYHDGKLWKVLQAHTVQESWKPDVASSLFVQVQIDSEQGTKDNPIPYSLNMELIEGKYYTQNNVTYLCIRALAQSVWDLSALVGNYVEVVE
jgi:hypothetical protein